jgi:hypothetical protein
MNMTVTPHAVRVNGRATFPFTSLADASKAYVKACEAIDARSQYEVLSHRMRGPIAPPCEVIDASGNCLAFISFNGKVWAGELNNNNYQCLYNPYSDARED